MKSDTITRSLIFSIALLSFIGCITASMSIFMAGIGAYTMNCDSKCNGKNNEACVSCNNNADRYPELLLFGCNVLLSTILCFYGMSTLYKIRNGSDENVN